MFDVTVYKDIAGICAITIVATQLEEMCLFVSSGEEICIS